MILHIGSYRPPKESMYTVSVSTNVKWRATSILSVRRFLSCEHWSCKICKSVSSASLPRFTSIGRYLFCTCMSARHVLLPGHELIMAVTQICQSRERLTTSRTFCQLLLRSKDQRRDFYKGICLSLPCWSAVTAVHVRWRTIAPMDLAWINMKTVISDY